MSHFDSLNDQALTAVLLRLPCEELDRLVETYGRIKLLTQQPGFVDAWKKLHIETIQSYEGYSGDFICLKEVLKSDMKTQHGTTLMMLSDTLQVVESVEYKHGVKHGLCKRWHKNGSLSETTTFKDGEEHGVCRHYGKRGDNILIEYSNGVPCGKYIRWYESGQLESICTYSKDSYRGNSVKAWYPNGTKRYTMTNGKLVYHDKYGHPMTHESSDYYAELGSSKWRSEF